MLRTALVTTALLVATLSTSAYSSDYGRGGVVSVEPRLSLSFGSLRHDGFRVDLDTGGGYYLPPPPRPVIVVPPTYIVVDEPRHRHFRRGYWRDHDRWDDRRHWRDDRHDRGRRHGHHDDD